MNEEKREPEPRIIVDDDWKAQVEAERQQLEREQAAGGGGGDADDQFLPPATFPTLVSTLATQAMVALGVLPDPVEGKPIARPEVAKHFIDLLGMLEEKTRGNLTAEEEAMIGDVVHQLRMAYVAVCEAVRQAQSGASSQDVPGSSASSSSPDPPSSSGPSIVLP